MSIKSEQCPRLRGLSRRSPTLWDEGGFTLLELLVVLGLVAALSVVLLGGLAGGGKSAALKSAQTTVANLLAAARVKAVATQREARVLFHIDPDSALAVERYLRYYALQQRGANGVWETAQTGVLADGVGVLPRLITSPSNLVAPGLNWTRPSDNGALRSSAFRTNQEELLEIDGAIAERWAAVTFSASGTTGNAGDLVLGVLRRIPPTDVSAGQSPVQFVNPEQVRGVSLSGYGLAVLINERSGF